MKVSADDGRIYLPKDTREKYGTDFRMIDMEDRLVLVPVSDNPLEKLRKITSGTDKSAEELKTEARKALVEDAGK